MNEEDNTGRMRMLSVLGFATALMGQELPATRIWSGKGKKLKADEPLYVARDATKRHNSQVETAATGFPLAAAERWFITESLTGRWLR